MEKSTEQQKAKSKPSPKKKTNRKLNVVYFIDSEKTKSFTMPLSRLNLIFAGLGLVLLWSVASSGLIYYLASDNIVVQKRYQQALSVIFDFQSRYQGVYDKAYPDRPNVTPPVVAAAPNQKPKIASQQKKPTKPIKIAKKTARAPVIAKPKPAAKVATKSKPVVAAKKEQPQSWSLELLKPKMSKRAKGFELSFAIRNRSKIKKKAQGYVWAIAKFVKTSGETIYLSAPPYIKINGKGSIVNAKRSHKYSIRNYKQKNFSFLAPAGISGRLVSLDIGLMTQEGKTKVKTIPQSINFSYRKPKPPVVKSVKPADQATGNPESKVEAKQSETGASLQEPNGAASVIQDAQNMDLPPVPVQTIGAKSQRKRGDEQSSVRE